MFNIIISNMIKDRIKYQKYLQSPRWKNLRIKFIQQQRNKCACCHKTRSSSKLHLHHITYERLYNESPEDLTLICEECYTNIHRIERQRKITILEATNIVFKLHINKNIKKIIQPVINTTKSFKIKDQYYLEKFTKLAQILSGKRKRSSKPYQKKQNR